MAATEDLDTASAVLTAAREQTQAVDLAEVRRFELAVDWAAMHSTDAIAGPWEGELSLAGEGAPEVAEFCVAEFALAIGKSTDAGRTYLGDALEVRYRLPRIWALVTAGRLAVWKARRIAQATVTLSMAAAGFVDRQVAPTAARMSLAQLDRTVEAARDRFDPEAAEARRLAAADGRRFDVHTNDVSFDGTVDVTGTLDLADALDLDEAIRDPAVSTRQVVLNVHTDGGPFAHVENTRSLHSLEQVRDWCHNSHVHVRQVIDLNEHRWNEGHDPTPLLREQILLTHPHCVFPRCTRPSRRCDLDHTIEHDAGGPTCSCNLAPICRTHHRLKTHAGWTYQRTGPTTFTWTSPHGQTHTTESHRHP